LQTLFNSNQQAITCANLASLSILKLFKENYLWIFKVINGHW
jgi:hypothetical protein